MEITSQTAMDANSRLAKLYEEQATGALRFALLLVGDRDRAEDLVHDAFVRIISRFAHRRHPDDFGAYLKRTMINLAISRTRRRKLESAFLQRERASAVDLTTSSPDIEQRNLLLEALLCLPYPQRLIVVLRLYEDLPEKEVARLLRKSPAAIRSTLHRAVTTLREHLQEEDDE